eukprot:tig00020710_g13244.t1
MRAALAAQALVLALLALATGCLGAPFTGRPLDPETLTPRGSLSVWDTEHSCSILNEETFSWNLQDYRGHLPVKRLSKNFTSLAPSPHGPFKHESRLAFWSDTIYYIDSDVDGVEKCFSLQMVGYEQNFRSYLDLMGLDATNSDPLASITNSGTNPVGLYLESYPERSRVLMFDTREPKQLRGGDQHVSWVEAPAGAPAAADQRIYLVAETSTLKLALPPLPANASRTAVETCGSHAFYTEFSRGAGGTGVPEATVALVSLDGGSPEALSSPLRARRAFLSQMDLLQAGGGEEGGPPLCAAAWLETGTALFADSEHFVAPDPASCLSDAVIRLLLLPSRDAFSFPPSSWSSPAYPQHVCVQGMRISGGYALLSLSDAARSSSILRLYSLETASWTDVPGSFSPQPLSIAAASAGAFVLYRGAGAARDVHVLRWSASSADPWHFSACRALPAGAPRPLLSVAIYRDQLVWKDVDASGGDARFNLIDLDEDNDGVFDSNDAFPTDGAEWRDSDNDGVGDEEDIWAASGSCVTSAERSACTSELIHLYIVYACVVFAAVVGMAAFLVYYWRLTRGLRVAPLDPFEGSVAGGTVFSGMSSSGGMLSRSASVSSEAPTILGLRPRPLPGGSVNGSFMVQPAAANDASSVGGPTPTLSPGPRVRLPPLVSRLEMLLRTGLLVMTLVSLALVLVPFYPYGGIPARLTATFVWVDFFFSTAFALDLIMRFLIRNRPMSFWKFFKANWADFPSLLTDIPGVASGTGGLGLLNVIVVTRFARAFRFFRFFKVFRAFRAYRRLSRQNLFVVLIVERPVAFLSLFTSAMILAASIVLKIVEQTGQSDFRDLGNVIW